jgi:alcohol dehydrogenase (cytochrome c)
VPNAGEPGSETWKGKLTEHRAGATWITGSYDPQLDLVYWSAGNPGSDFDGDNREGDNLYTDSVLALEAKTGKVVWGHSYPCPLAANNFEGGPCATPTVADGRVYTFSRKGDLFCLDAAKGTVIWSKNLNRELGLEIPTWGCASSVLVEGAMAVVNMGGAGAALGRDRVLR